MVAKVRVRSIPFTILGEEGPQKDDHLTSNENGCFLNNNKVDSYADASFVIARAALAGAAVFCIVAALRCKTADVLKNALGATINVIAFLHYCNIDALKLHKKEDSLIDVHILSIRLADWSATLPLLVLEIHLFMESSFEEAAIGCGLSFVMVIFGAWWHAIHCNYSFWEFIQACACPGNGNFNDSFLCILLALFFFFAWGCLTGIAFNFYRFLWLSNTAQDVIVCVFTGPWIFYGIVFMWPKWLPYDVSEDSKNVCYNILDVHSKAIFAFTLAIRTL